MSSPFPSVIGFHHITLTVSDLDRSFRWYNVILGFEAVDRRSEGDLEKVVMTRRGIRLILVQHHGRPAGSFDERRAGLDHLSFSVSDNATLDMWKTRLESAGVTCDEAQGMYGKLIAFRDPDNIALEFYSLS